MDGTPQRDEKGRLLPGAAPINPEGKNGHMEGYQRYGDRAAALLAKYTVKQIREMVTDQDAMDALPFYDGIIIKHLARTMNGDEIGQERERLLNRMEGKPKETITLKGDMALHGLTDDELKRELAAALTAAGFGAGAQNPGGDAQPEGAGSTGGIPAAVDTKPV